MCFDFNDSSVWDIEIESVNPTDSYDVVLAIIVPFYSYFFFFLGVVQTFTPEFGSCQ